MEILLVMGLIGIVAAASVTTGRRLARRRATLPNHRQFYLDGTMTQEIEALKLETQQIKVVKPR